MAAAVVLSLSFLQLLPLSAAWTQQYGDAASTSYVDYQGPVYTGWNYTTEPFVSQTSPSVTEQGVIFYPLRAYMIALSPNGTVLWKTGVAPEGNAYLTNTVYSKEHDLAIVGGSWTYFQVVAVHAKNGTIAWKSTQLELYVATTISISVAADALYCGWMYGNTFSALRLKDGSILWKKNSSDTVGVFMQTKVGPFPSNVELSPLAHNMSSSEKSNLEIAVLPTDPFDGFDGKGRLYAYDDSKPYSYWHSDLGFSAGGLFAFSNQGMIYGCDGGGGGPQGQQIFGVLTQNGSVVFNSPGYCEQTSGPAVDVDGYAYYSCGNQVFSIFPNGSLRWTSQPLGKATLNSVTGPSIHPDGYVYFIHNNQTRVFALSSKNGSLHKAYTVKELGYLEPPILLGNKFMYLLGFQGSSIVIYPVEL